MKRLLALLARLLPFVVDHGPVERHVMRVAFAVVAFLAIRWGLPFESQPKPNGLAQWIDFTFLADRAWMEPLRIATIVSLAAYAFGLVPVLSLAVPLAVSVGVGTLINSQGAINHDTQVVSMILLGQWLVHLVAGIRSGNWWRVDADWENIAVHVSKIAVMAGYMVSAVVKLDETDGRWIHNVPQLAVQMKKANDSKFSSDLEPMDPFASETLPRWIVDHPWQSRALFGSGLLLELFCFVGLAGRRWGLATALALILMHLTIGRLMSLHFVSNMAVLAIFFVNVPGWPKLLRDSPSPNPAKA